MLATSKGADSSLSDGLQLAEASVRGEGLHFLFHGVDELFQKPEMRA
jgi:acid stress-induced BolA-like protein IbaG/YrbA